MYPRPFEYTAPSSVADAVRVLSNSDYAKVLSGGMSLIPMMKLRLLSPEVIVDIGGIPGLDAITESESDVAIGALVRHAQTARSSLVPAALRQAAAWTGDAQVRNRGTTCGSIAHADMAADQTAAVLALGGIMVAEGPRGPRNIRAEDFFVDAMTTALHTSEVLTAVRLPRSGGSSAYEKLGRRGGHADYAIAGAAAWVRMEAGLVAEARIAVTGVGLRPQLSPSMSEGLVGTDGGDRALASAADRVTDDVGVIEDLFGSVDYKRHLAKVLARRAAAAAIAGGSA